METEWAWDAFVADIDRITDDDILLNDLMRVYEKMRQSQTPLEPEFAAALYTNRAAMYRLF